MFERHAPWQKPAASRSRVTHEAEPFPHNHIRCEPEGSGTRLYEHIEITSPRLLLKTTYCGGALSHKEMFVRVNAHIEQERVSV